MGGRFVDKLIIHHGDRVTEHELGEAPLTIGRDPECDLFFADKKLSRKHARVERVGVGFRLVDLESRNGSWVNEVRVEARDLAPGDEIRLGGLRIAIERERDRDPADESTIYLTAAAPPLPDTGTVVLAADAAEKSLPPPSTVTLSPDDSSTVFLTPAPSNAFAELDEADETMKKPEPERTVVLAGQLPGKLYNTGTVVFRGQADPSLQEAATRLVPRKAQVKEEIELFEEEEPGASEPSLTASVTYVPQPETIGRGWAARFAPLAAALGVFALLVVALPLLRILSAALVEESSSRARALVDLLAAANETALAEGRVQDVSVDRVAAEPGVVGAYILSPTGEVLAPKDRAGQALAIDGLSGGVADIRSFREGRDSNGDRILAQPLIHRGRRVGVAVLTHRSPAAGLPWVALLFGSLLLAIAVAGVVLLARKMTVSPLNDLRLEVDALGEGRGAALAVERPYSELSQLASSLNRVLAARQAISGAESMESRKPGAQDRH
jgi:predicted component of type VI protein secretion system